LLQADDHAVLGSWPDLVVLRGAGVQCRPRDDRLVAVRVELDRTATRWELDAELSAIQRTAPDGALDELARSRTGERGRADRDV
jgi:hypothetical protein